MKKIVAVLMSILLLTQGGAAWGATFTDLKDAEWAEPYINKMAEKSIITGYLGQYKPSDSVNKYSATVMIYRTLKAAGKVDSNSISSLTTKYNSVLTQYNVPAWPDLKEAVSFFLDNSIIQADDLKYFMNGSEHINVRRYELCTYLGKALNLYLKESTTAVISLPFKDSSSITGTSAPYINLLYKKGILNGDLEGNFKPYDMITRSSMAKVLSLSLEALANSATITPTPVVTTPSPTVKQTSIEGTVQYVISDGQKIVVGETGNTTNSSIYSVLSTTGIYYSGVKKDFSYLGKEQSVKLTFEESKLVRIDIGSWSSTSTSSSASDYTVNKVENNQGFYTLTLTDYNSKKKEYFTIAGLKTMTIDGSAVPITNLGSGDVVRIRLNDDGKIIDVVGRTRNKTYEGILQSTITTSGKPQIVIKTESGTSVTLELDTSIAIRRNDTNCELTDLKAGDYLKVKTTYEKVTSLYAYSLSKTTYEGTITGLSFGKSDKMTILTDDQLTKEFDISPTATVKIDNATSDAESLRVNYTVTITVEGTTLTKIVATKTASKDQIAGIITKIYNDLNLITIRTTSGAENVYQTVTVNSSTTYINSNGTKAYFNSLDANDSVFVYGKAQDNFFLAEKIILLN